MKVGSTTSHRYLRSGNGWVVARVWRPLRRANLARNSAPLWLLTFSLASITPSGPLQPVLSLQTPVRPRSNAQAEAGRHCGYRGSILAEVQASRSERLLNTQNSDASNTHTKSMQARLQACPKAQNAFKFQWTRWMLHSEELLAPHFAALFMAARAEMYIATLFTNLETRHCQFNALCACERLPSRYV